MTDTVKDPPASQSTSNERETIQTYQGCSLIPIQGLPQRIQHTDKMDDGLSSPRRGQRLVISSMRLNTSPARPSGNRTLATRHGRRRQMYSLVGQVRRTPPTTQAMSSRVPGPTVDRRMPVNSGAARMGATTLCLHVCVLTQKEKSIVSCNEAKCLSWRVVLERHTPAVRLCDSSSHKKPSAGIDHQPCGKVHHVSQDRVLHPLGLPLMPQ